MSTLFGVPQKYIIFLYILDRFDALISKINFKIIKSIILMHFGTKNTLKNNHNHTPNQTRRY